MFCADCAEKHHYLPVRSDSVSCEVVIGSFEIGCDGLGVRLKFLEVSECYLSHSPQILVASCDNLVTYKDYSRVGRFCSAQSGMHLYTNQVELETRTRAYECKGVSHSTGHIIYDIYISYDL